MVMTGDSQTADGFGRTPVGKTAGVDVCMFSTRTYDRASFDRAAGADRHRFRFVDARLAPETVPLAEGCDAVCAFVNDDVGEATLRRLAAVGVRHVALRSRRVQPRRPARGRRARRLGRPRAGLLPQRRRRAHDCVDPRRQPPHRTRPLPGARPQLQPRGPGRLRSQGQDRGRHRNGQHRRARRPPAVALPMPCAGIRSGRRRDACRARGHVRGARRDVAAVRHHLAQRSATRQPRITSSTPTRSPVASAASCSSTPVVGR